jgi:TrwC relaxase
MLGAGSDPARYYLSRQANCPADYYLCAEPAGRWLGSGATAIGLSGRLDPAGAETLRALLAGRSGDGLILVPELSQADPRGRLPAKPLVDAIRRQADQQAARVGQRGVATMTCAAGGIWLSDWLSTTPTSVKTRRPALVAQGIEHRFPKPCVAGSNPAEGTNRVVRSRLMRDGSVSAES